MNKKKTLHKMLLPFSVAAKVERLILRYFDKKKTIDNRLQHSNTDGNKTVENGRRKAACR